MEVNFVKRSECPFHSGLAHSLAVLVEGVFDPVTNRVFSIKRCSICGVGLLDPYPTPDTVSELYRGRGSDKIFDPISKGIIDRLKDFFAYREYLWILKQFGSRCASFLDFGTGNSRLALAAARSRRLKRVTAVDFDDYPPVGFVNNGFCDLKYESLSAFWESEERFDLIAMRHVLEHIHDPVQLLKRLSCRLNNGGGIYIEVPDQKSALVKFFGKITNAYSVPQHIYFFDRYSLFNIVEKSGLKVEFFGKVSKPMVGSVLSEIFCLHRKNVHQFAGIVLHPVQLILEAFYGKQSIAVVVKRR